MHGVNIEPTSKASAGHQAHSGKLTKHSPTPLVSFNQTLNGRLERASGSTLSNKVAGSKSDPGQPSTSIEKLSTIPGTSGTQQTDPRKGINFNQADEIRDARWKQSKGSTKKVDDLLSIEQDEKAHIKSSAATEPSDKLTTLTDPRTQSKQLAGTQAVDILPTDPRPSIFHRAADSTQPLSSNQDLNARNPKVSGKVDRPHERPSHGFDTFTSTHRDRKVSPPQLLTQSKENIPHAKPSQALNPNQAQVHEEITILPQSQKPTPSANTTAAKRFQTSLTQSSRLADNQLLTQSKENIPHAKPFQALNPNQAQGQEEAPILPHFRKLANSPDSIASSFDKHLGDRTKQPGLESYHIRNNSTASVWEAREWAKARNTQRRPGGKNLPVFSSEVDRREINAQDKRAGIGNEKKVSQRKSAKTTFASAFQLTSRTNSSTNTADGMPPAQTQSDRVEPHAMRHDSSHNHKTMESMSPQPFDKLDVENHASKQERETYPLNRVKLGETEAGQRPASTGEARSEISATRSDLTTHGAIIPRTRLEGLNVPQSNASTIQRLENIIQDQVKVLNSASSKTLSVAVKPDSGLAMTLTLQQVDQQILVSARMDEHTANLLKPQWAELQKELESQGIRLNHQDSDQPFQSKHQQTRDESMSQDNGEKWSKQTQYREPGSKHSEKPTQVKTKNSPTTLDSSPEEHLYYA